MAPSADHVAAVAHLAGADPAMARLIDAVGPCTLGPRRIPGGAFGSLARAIAYQQLAGPAARAIHARFALLYGGRPTAAAVLATPDEHLRSVGLSAAKTASIKDLAAKVLDGTVRLRNVSALSDHEVVARLSTVRGIGRWTAEMFLIFDLMRPDVWPVDDLGVRKGWAIAHGHRNELPMPKELEILGDPCRPHRSVAAWYCWRAVSLTGGEW